MVEGLPGAGVLLGQSGLFTQLKKRIIDRTMEAEMDQPGDRRVFGRRSIPKKKRNYFVPFLSLM